MEISLERALEHVPLAAEITGVDGLIRYVNPAFERLTGTTGRDAIGARAAVLLAGVADVGAHSGWERALAGDTWTGELVRRAADGTDVHLELTITPIRDAAGRVEAVYSLGRDVTERARAEREVRDSAELYRQFFQNNRAIKLLIDPSTGAIIDANAAAAQFYGYPAEVLRSMRIQEINTLPPDEIARELACAETEARTYFRFPHRIATGELRRVEVFSGPVSYRGAKLLFSIIHDVTDRERAEAELVRSEARFRALLRQLPIGVVVHREGRIVYANEAISSLLGGTDPATIVGTPVLAHVDPSYQASVAERIEALTIDGTTAPLRRERLLRSDRTAVDAEVRGLPIDFDGAPAVMALIVDVSERDRLEEQLRGAQRMEAVGRLAGGVAHDFNNLLFVILNVARFLLKKLPEGDPLRADAEQIETAGRRAADLTRQLLLFSRGAETAAVSVELRDVVDDIARLLRGTLGEHVEIVVTRGEAPCFVKIARPHLEQVLVNLAVNARDAMPAGGTLSFETTRIDPPGDGGLLGNAVGYVRLVVRDTGVGMSASVAAHAFEPFFSTKEQGRGTGLGLAITYGIVQKGGGRIALETAPSQGTTFTIALPAAEPIAATAPPPSPRPQEGAGETILVVEDEDAVRATVVRALREHGYEVLSASGAAEALRTGGSVAHIHLLLTDVIMPNTSGPELARRLRELRPSIRVLYMSGYAGDALADRGVPIEDVMYKPFDETDLLARVRTALGRKSAPAREGQ